MKTLLVSLFFVFSIMFVVLSYALNLKDKQLASKYNIFSIPTLAIFRNGQVVSQVAGAASKESIRNYIGKNIQTEVST